MKTFFASFLLLLASTSTYAGTMIIEAREVTCKELKATVDNYREVIVISKGLFGKMYTRVWSQRPHCRPFSVPARGYFKTQDKRHCQAGMICERVRDPRFPDRDL